MVLNTSLVAEEDAIKINLSLLNSMTAADNYISNGHNNDVEMTSITDNNNVNASLKGENENTPKNRNLEQLSTNALPPYSPGDFPSFLNKNERETHSCSVCGDTFILKSSLSSHLQRRSVLIHFHCNSCPSIQVFYNRCSLLSHIRTHTDKQEPSDISKATISPLPEVLMDGLQTDVIKTLLEEDDDDENLSNSQSIESPVTKLLEVTICEVDDKVQFASDTKQYLNRKKEVTKNIHCSECNKEFHTFEERHDHFVNKDKLPNTLSRCQKCGILCPSECSSKAHKRLHLQVSPYVCPECGDNPDRYWENFQRHLTYHCFHYARSFGLKCTLCNELVSSAEQLKEHTITNHIEILYKCQMCPMAFTNFTNFQVHRHKIHEDDVSTHVEPLQMYKCLKCDVVFLDKEDSDAHCDQHLKENICRYTFRCSECDQLQESKSHLHDHLKDKHPEIYQKNIALVISNSNANAAPNKSVVGLNTTRVECMLCHAAFMTRQGHSVHVTKSHSNHKYPCGVCSKTTVNRLAMITHGKEHLKEGRSICLLCHNKVIRSPETLEFHLLYHVERIKYQTFCPVCELPLYSFMETLHHIHAEHFVKTTINIAKNTSPVSSSTENAQTMPKNPHVWNSRDSSQHKVPVTVRSYENPQSESFLWKTRIQTGMNQCGKCDLKTSDRDEFKKHLLTHKDKKMSYQCMECAYCFVVEPSLKKHLKISHKVPNVDQYIAQEGTNFSPEVEAISDIVKSNDLECTVCFEIFESESQLKTHMRSHGMAFIQSKKSSLV